MTSNIVLCLDIKEKKEYALKIQTNQTNLNYNKFFKNEVMALNELNHPNIIKMYDFHF